MAWDTDYLIKLRYLLNDITATYKYDDLFLKTYLAMATTFVQEDLADYSIGQPYAITMSPPTIIPDPMDVGLSGLDNLIILRAAAMIDFSEIRQLYASGGIKIVDNKSTIDLTGNVAMAKLRSQSGGFKELYQQMLDAFKNGNKYAGAFIFNVAQEN